MYQHQNTKIIIRSIAILEINCFIFIVNLKSEENSHVPEPKTWGIVP